MTPHVSIGAVCLSVLLFMEPDMIQQTPLEKLEACYEVLRPATLFSEKTFTWMSGVHHPYFNLIMHLHSSTIEHDIEELFQLNVAHAPLSVLVHPENRAVGLEDYLCRKGFQSVGTFPLLSWKVAPVPSPSKDIRQIDSSMDVFMDILGEAFGLPTAVNKWYGTLLKNPKATHILIYVDGCPVGTGSLIRNERSGGIFNISVKPNYRRKGLATHIMHYLMAKAHSEGLHELVLWSAPDAATLYEKCGFQHVFDMELYTNQSTAK